MHSYHISDRDEGHDNDDDEGGSKAFPSRETWGAAWSIGEKHPSLTEPLILFFGLWRIPMWGYYWQYTLAQIELLSVDGPLISYNRKNRTKDNKSAPAVRAEDVNRKVKEWQEKYGGGKTEVILDFSQYTQKDC